MAIAARTDKGAPPLISIVAPCYNESETVDLFVDAIEKIVDDALVDVCLRVVEYRLEKTVVA